MQLALSSLSWTFGPRAVGSCRSAGRGRRQRGSSRRGEHQPGHSSVNHLCRLCRSCADGPAGRPMGRLGAPIRGQESVRGVQIAMAAVPKEGTLGFQGVHHVAVIVSNLETSLKFYCGTLGLSINDERPDDKLPYAGAWLWIGPEMIHLMELPNPDPLDGRPEHGGRDRHFCVGVKSVAAVTEQLDAAGIAYTSSKSGRPAIFFRDPDMNCLECVEVAPWRSDIQ